MFGGFTVIPKEKKAEVQFKSWYGQVIREFMESDESVICKTIDDERDMLNKTKGFRAYIKAKRWPITVVKRGNRLYLLKEES